MRALETEVISALQARTLVARDFIWFVVRDRETGDPVSDGMWSDITNVTAPVINPDTGSSEDRAFYGAGGLIQIGDIPLVSNLTVQRVSVRLSQVDDRVETLVRTYDMKQARVEIFRGLFDPDTRALVSPAVPRFVGYIDGVTIKTATENEDGYVDVTCVSSTQEMLRSNPDTRSHESQKIRNASDDFFLDATVVGDWEFNWGNASGRVETKPAGLFGWGNVLGFL